MRNYVSRYATMYRYKWRPDTKHSASELKRSSWVQYIKHWLISSTTHMRALISSPQSCTHVDASGQRSMFATTLGTFAAGLRTIQSSTHWEKKYDTAWGIEKLVVTTEAPCSVQNNGHITFWSFNKLQTGLRSQSKQLVENLSKFWIVAIFLLKILSNKRSRVKLIKCILNLKIPCFTPHFNNCIGIIDGRDASGYQWCLFGSAN